AGVDEVADAGFVADSQRRSVAAYRGERYEHLTERIDVLVFPVELRRRARVLARNAAQQAVCRRLLGGVSGIDVAKAEIQRAGADRVEARSGALEAREIHACAEFAAKHRLIERVGVVDYRQDVRQSALNVRFGKSVI